MAEIKDWEDFQRIIKRKDDKILEQEKEIEEMKQQFNSLKFQFDLKVLEFDLELKKFLFQQQESQVEIFKLKHQKNYETIMTISSSSSSSCESVSERSNYEESTKDNQTLTDVMQKLVNQLEKTEKIYWHQNETTQREIESMKAELDDAKVQITNFQEDCLVNSQMTEQQSEKSTKVSAENPKSQENVNFVNEKEEVAEFPDNDRNKKTIEIREIEFETEKLAKKITNLKEEIENCDANLQKLSAEKKFIHEKMQDIKEWQNEAIDLSHKDFDLKKSAKKFEGLQTHRSEYERMKIKIQLGEMRAEELLKLIKEAPRMKDLQKEREKIIANHWKAFEKKFMLEAELDLLTEKIESLTDQKFSLEHHVS